VFYPRTHMKNILSILTVLALAAAAQAGCGVTVTTQGLLKSYDPAKKEIVVTPLKGAKDVSITLTPETTGTEGLKDLVGKGVVKVEASKHSATKAISIETVSDILEPKKEEKTDKKKKEKKEKKA